MLLSRTRLWEARVQDLKDAHEREVKHLKMMADVLAEQIEYLRAQAAGQPFIPTRVQGTNPAELEPVAPGGLAYMGEEEEDLRALAAYDHITPQALEQALDAMGLRNTQIAVDQD